MRIRLWAALLAVAVLAALAGGLVWHNGRVQAERDAALAAASAGDLARAEPLLRAAAARNPDDRELLRTLARIELDRGHKAEAEETLTRWVRAAPDDPEPLQRRAELYRTLAAYDQALADVDRLIALDPDSVALRRRRAGLLFSAGRFAEADEQCARCLEAQPGDRGLLRLRAEIKRARGEPDAAMRLLDELLAANPEDNAALFMRGLLAYEAGDAAGAVRRFRQLLARDPNRQRTARYHLSLALARAGQADEARRLMDEVRHMQDAEVLLEDSKGQPDNLPLQLRAARAQFENGNLPKTLEIVGQVLQRDPAYAPAHALLADVYDRQGRFDLAAEERRRAGAAAPAKKKP